LEFASAQMLIYGIGDATCGGATVALKTCLRDEDENEIDSGLGLGLADTEADAETRWSELICLSGRPARAACKTLGVVGNEPQGETCNQCDYSDT
jgi:hypothetical protein